VLTTLHTNDAVGAVARLRDLGVPSFLIAATLTGVVAQRLVRLVCPHCKAAVIYPAELLAKVNLTPADGVTFYKGAGCDHCGGTGYRGRTGVFEILMIDAGRNELVRERADSRRLKEGAIRSGFKSLLEDALSKAVLGQTTLDEVLRVSYE